MSDLKLMMISVSAALVITVIAFFVAKTMVGDGGFKRLTTLSGMYAVCKTGGYDVVCFSGKGNDGISCLPLSQIGGKCL